MKRGELHYIEIFFSLDSSADFGTLFLKVLGVGQVVAGVVVGYVLNGLCLLAAEIESVANTCTNQKQNGNQYRHNTDRVLVDQQLK